MWRLYRNMIAGFWSKITVDGNLERTQMTDVIYIYLFHYIW
jgi:hypothetical protein